MSSQAAPRKRVTIHELRRMKDAGEKIAMVTAYDATAARLVAAAEVDAVLVGDSVGMAVQGHDSTLPVTLDQMVYHSAMVRRGLEREGGRPHLVGDLGNDVLWTASADRERSAQSAQLAVQCSQCLQEVREPRRSRRTEEDIVQDDESDDRTISSGSRERGVV